MPQADGDGNPGLSGGEGPPTGPQTLADLAPRVRMGWVGWVIGICLFVAVLSFFIVVVCLGVDNS